MKEDGAYDKEVHKVEDSEDTNITSVICIFFSQ